MTNNELNHNVSCRILGFSLIDAKRLWGAELRSAFDCSKTPCHSLIRHNFMNRSDHSFMANLKAAETAALQSAKRKPNQHLEYILVITGLLPSLVYLCISG